MYEPYLAQHLDPIVKPTGAFVSSLSLHAQRVGSPVVEQLTKLSLLVWQRFFPAPEPVKEATLLEKVKETVELAREKVEDVFVGGAQSTEDSQLEGEFEEEEEETVEVALAEEEELVEFDDAGMVDEAVDVDISTEETEIEDLAPTPELMPLVPVLATEEYDASLAEEITSSDHEAQPELLEEQIDEEEFSTDEEDEDDEDEDAEFLASLEASDDPVQIAVPDITEPELPDLPAVDDTPAELSEKEALKKAAVAEMRAEIEKKQHDFEEKMARVGDIEERKLIDKVRLVCFFRGEIFRETDAVDGCSFSSSTSGLAPRPSSLRSRSIGSPRSKRTLSRPPRASRSTSSGRTFDERTSSLPSSRVGLESTERSTTRPTASTTGSPRSRQGRRRPSRRQPTKLTWLRLRR